MIIMYYEITEICPMLDVRYLVFYHADSVIVLMTKFSSSYEQESQKQEQIALLLILSQSWHVISCLHNL